MVALVNGSGAHMDIELINDVMALVLFFGIASVAILSAKEKGEDG